MKRGEFKSVRAAAKAALARMTGGALAPKGKRKPV